MPAADGIGTLPLSAFGIEQWVYKVFREHILLSNVITMAIQALALVAIPFISVTRILLLLYDGMHASIAALTGIFFYMWICLNVAFAIALSFIRVNFTWIARLIFVTMTLLAPRAFTIFQAGWYETPFYNRISIDAIMSNGRAVRVSPRIFGILSYYFYSDYTLDPHWKTENTLPVAFYGTAYTSAVRQIADKCVLPPERIQPL